MRNWERKGKIPEPPRSRGGLRFYPKETYVPYFQVRGYKMPGIQLANKPAPFKLLPLGSIDVSLFDEERDGHLLLALAIHKATEAVLNHWDAFMDTRSVWRRVPKDGKARD